MGESSEPRRPTHDTNTSRRQVSTHTSTTSTTTTTTLQQIQTHYEVYWIDCIYLLLWLQQLPQGPLHFQNLNIVAMPTMQSVSHASKVYRKRSSAGYTLPFPDVLLRLQFVATPTMQNVRHASSV